MTTATKTKRKHWTDAWAKHGPCAEGLAFAKSTKSITEFWRTCKRGDWMLWMAGETCGDDRRKLTLAACECARLALPYVTKDDDRPRVAIETAERWARGEVGVTLDDVRKATNAANAAANAAVAAATAAARAAAIAATTTRAAAAAANAAYAAYATASRLETLAKCAEIVRRHYPKPPRIRSAK